MKLSSLFFAHLAALLTVFVLGCGGAFRRPDISWPKTTDGRTIIPYQLVREGSVQDITLRPMNVAPMTPASEAAWREAIGKWNTAGGGAVQFVETDRLMPWGNSPGVLIYDVTELPDNVEGQFAWYAPDGPVLRARAYCGAITPKSDIRFARYFRLHEVGHAALLPHSTIPTAVMWPWRIDILGAPSVDLTSSTSATFGSAIPRSPLRRHSLYETSLRSQPHHHLRRRPAQAETLHRRRARAERPAQ